MSHMSATCAHGVTFQSFTVPTMYDYCAVQMLSERLFVALSALLKTSGGMNSSFSLTFSDTDSGVSGMTFTF